MTKEIEKVVKSAITDFENDDFISAKEKIQGVIKDKKNDFLKDKLGLKNDLDPKPEEESDDSKDGDE